ncbi:MAG: extracellular solute-binding protein [Anaerolineales bacterium]|nr:extracellular solute-binding protein [Anaerolineales bacterium]
MRKRILLALSLLLISSMVLSACGTPAEEEKVTVSWWHITSDPGPHQDAWQAMADAYMAEHPNVIIEITILENEAFKSKLPTVMQSGEPPDLFQSWGGGTMIEYAKAGLLKDITADVAGEWGDSIGAGALGVYAYDGVQYGVPWDMGAVGWWYNKDLFAQAGIDAPPTTWTEFLNDIQALKDAGITPIALGEGEKWPGHFYWVYLAVRLGGEEAFNAAYNRTGSFADSPFVEAGEKLQELIAMEPFQDGYQGMGHNDSEALIGNGEAAMLLMGQWAPQTMIANSTSGEGIGDALGYFSFPAVEGGAGALTDVMGGGNGIIVGKNAEPEAVDFLRYLTNLENQSTLAEIGAIIPVVSGAEAALTDPNMVMVYEAVNAADYYQLYYDQFMPPAVGEAVNDSVQGLFAGTMSPEEVAQAIEAAASAELD